MSRMKIAIGVLAAVSVAGVLSVLGLESFPWEILALVVATACIGKWLRPAAEWMAPRMPHSPLVRVAALSLISGVGFYYTRQILHTIVYAAYGMYRLANTGRFPVGGWNDWGLVFFPTALLSAVLISKFTALELAPRVFGVRCRLQFWLNSVVAWLVGSWVGALVSGLAPGNRSEPYIWLAGLLPDILPDAVDRWSLREAAIMVAILVVSFGSFALCIVRSRWSAIAVDKKSSATWLLLVSVLAVGSAHSFDEATHQTYLTRDSAILLNNITGATYQELIRYSALSDSAMQIGTGGGDNGEDSGCNPVNHFFQPTDGQGLEQCDLIPGWVCPVCTDALSWLSAGQHYDIALQAYRGGDKAYAYRWLGRLIHLVTQDMFSPPHVFLDAHLMVYSFDTWVNERDNIEEDPRRWGMGVSTKATESLPAELLLYNATLTYRAVRVEGDLHEDASAPASGRLAEMFPVNYYQAIKYDTFLVDEWVIPDVGNCDKDSGAVGNPDIFDEWWLVPNFDEEAGKFYYFEEPYNAYPRSYNGITIPENQKADSPNKVSLAELWALGHTVAGVQIGERLLASGRGGQSLTFDILDTKKGIAG